LNPVSALTSSEVILAGVSFEDSALSPSRPRLSRHWHRPQVYLICWAMIRMLTLPTACTSPNSLQKSFLGFSKIALQLPTSQVSLVPVGGFIARYPHLKETSYSIASPNASSVLYVISFSSSRSMTVSLHIAFQIRPDLILFCAKSSWLDGLHNAGRRYILSGNGIPISRIAEPYLGTSDTGSDAPYIAIGCTPMLSIHRPILEPRDGFPKSYANERNFYKTGPRES
jgi:hypothetical protein